jgi:hypothetical protein
MISPGKTQPKIHCSSCSPARTEYSSSRTTLSSAPSSFLNGKSSSASWPRERVFAQVEEVNVCRSTSWTRALLLTLYWEVAPRVPASTVVSSKSCESMVPATTATSPSSPATKSVLSTTSSSTPHASTPTSPPSSPSFSRASTTRK